MLQMVEELQYSLLTWILALATFHNAEAAPE